MRYGMQTLCARELGGEFLQLPDPLLIVHDISKELVTSLGRVQLLRSARDVALLMYKHFR